MKYGKSGTPAEGVQPSLLGKSQTLKLFLVLFIQWHHFLGFMTVSVSQNVMEEQGQLGY